MPAPGATTGRYLVLLSKDKLAEGTERLAELAQVRIVHHGSQQTQHEVLPNDCAWVFDHIGVALLRCGPAAGRLLQQSVTDPDGAILAIEPEREVHATMGGDGEWRQGYLQGYRDAIEDLTRRLAVTPQRTDASFEIERATSWGVSAVGADTSPYTGKGARVAILDTGLDMQHPDFVGRKIITQSFISGETAQDTNGHGTHCAGIAVGPSQAVQAPEGRYGVASGADLFIGKVLSDAGHGADGGVLAGIDWAIENGCHIVSMSLGSAVSTGEAYSQVFEAVAQRALEAGSLLIAAAGNESRRPEHIAPVGHPANCPSILAVAALDEALDVAPFSCGGLNPTGGEVNVAAPGVNIWSAWPMPEPYHRSSGTSMATPFVAGVAALYVEADASARGSALGERLAREARILPLPARDVGAGLVQAPPSMAEAVTPLPHISRQG